MLVANILAPGFHELVLYFVKRSFFCWVIFFQCDCVKSNAIIRLLVKPGPGPGPGPWTLDPDSEKPGP